MSTIERIVVTILFVGACIFADATSRRIKRLELAKNEKCDCCMNAVREDLHRTESQLCSLRRWAELLAGTVELQDKAIADLSNRCAGCCLCPPPSPCACPTPAPCACKKHTCCPPKKIESKPPPPPSKFCRFTMIQIDGSEGKVWFKWLDTDGELHETRMALAKFEGWGRNDK